MQDAYECIVEDDSSLSAKAGIYGRLAMLCAAESERIKEWFNKTQGITVQEEGICLELIKELQDAYTEFTSVDFLDIPNYSAREERENEAAVLSPPSAQPSTVASSSSVGEMSIDVASDVAVESALGAEKGKQGGVG